MLEVSALTRPLEQSYPIADDDAFKVVNTAVWYTLTRLLPGSPIPRDQVDGGTCYHLSVGTQGVQLYVLRISPHLAEIRLHLLLPLDPIERTVWQLQSGQQHARGQIEEALGTVLAFCDMEIAEMLHRAATVEGSTPLPPATNEQIVRWWLLYHRQKTVHQLVRLIEQTDGRQIPAQTLYNIRSKQIAAGDQKTTKRGRKSKNR
jgi:hypothetical protein